MSMRHIFIINPAAGVRDNTTFLAGTIRSAAQGCQLDYEIHVTERPMHACELVRRVADERPGEEMRFYACGGDGTLNEVAAGVLGLPNASLTHMPAGTGNDFLKMFGAHVERFRDLKALSSGDELEVDCIEADCGVAVNVMSVGLDARVAKGMNRYRRTLRASGQLPYLLSTVEQICRGMARSYSVTVDGECLDGKYTLILAANGRHYGGGFHPVPQADATDGLLDVLLVRGLGRLEAARVIDVYKAGRFHELPQYITYRKAREMTVFSQDGRAMEVNRDGEITMTCRVALRVREHGLRFAVPRGVKQAGPAYVDKFSQ